MILQEVVRGEVAAILDTDKIAINKGERDGVARDDRVHVMGSREIRDPQTSEVLGDYEYLKADLYVTETYSRYSVAIMPQSFSAQDSIFGAAFDRVKSAPRLAPDPTDRPSFVVHVGDLVILVREVAKSKA